MVTQERQLKLYYSLKQDLQAKAKYT